jgi:hypothetical protein
MNANSRFLVWGPFAVAVLLSWTVAEVAWSIRPYFLLLDLLGILNVILAVRVLMHTGLKLWPTLGVMVGLLIGLRSFIESAVTRFLWSLRGFAP